MKEDITVSDPLEKAIIELIQSVPAIWQHYESDALTSTQQKALTFLLAAELVEQRRSIKLREIGNSSKVVLVTFRATGEYGLVEVTDKLAAAVPEWVGPEGELSNEVLCEHEPAFQMRLTDQGELAQKDLADGKYSLVLDFVKKTNSFADREPVRGQGIVESLDIQNPSTPQSVSVQAAAAQASIGNIQIINQINNDAIAEAIATVAEKLAGRPASPEEKKVVHQPGPERLTLHEAKERVRILRRWAEQQDINMDDRHSKMSLAEFAERNNTTAKNVSNYQSWYRKYRKRGTLPKDPRMVPPSKLKQLFG